MCACALRSDDMTDITFKPIATGLRPWLNVKYKKIANVFGNFFGFISHAATSKNCKNELSRFQSVTTLWLNATTYFLAETVLGCAL